MNESIDKLEKDLASLRPRALSRELVERLAEDLDPAPRRWADRVLGSFVGAGALAACVIVGVVTWNVIGGANNASPQPADMASFTPASLAAYQQMLARGSSPPPAGLVDPLSATR